MNSYIRGQHQLSVQHEILCPALWRRAHHQSSERLRAPSDPAASTEWHHCWPLNFTKHQPGKGAAEVEKERCGKMEENQLERSECHCGGPEAVWLTWKDVSLSISASLARRILQQGVAHWAKNTQCTCTCTEFHLEIFSRGGGGKSDLCWHKGVGQWLLTLYVGFYIWNRSFPGLPRMYICVQHSVLFSIHKLKACQPY